MKIAFNNSGKFFFHPQDPVRSGYQVREISAEEEALVDLGKPLRLVAGNLSSIPPKEPTLIQKMDDLYKSLLTEEQQGQFGVVWSAIRIQLRNQEYNLARLTITATPVPPELDGIKQQILDALPTES